MNKLVNEVKEGTSLSLSVLHTVCLAQCLVFGDSDPQGGGQKL